MWPSLRHYTVKVSFKVVSASNWNNTAILLIKLKWSLKYTEIAYKTLWTISVYFREYFNLISKIAVLFQLDAKTTLKLLVVLDFSPDLISLLGRWYRGCRQVGRQFGNLKPKWECATSTNTEGYWTTLRDCLQQELQSQDNCLHDQRKLNRSENPETAWILL